MMAPDNFSDHVMCFLKAPGKLLALRRMETLKPFTQTKREQLPLDKKRQMNRSEI